MVYFMSFKVDGGCRNNGYRNAVAAAACCLFLRGHRYKYKTEEVPTPTNQRAEITAIIMALEWALDKYYHELDTSPRLLAKIKSDSRYAVNCMNEWIYKWTRNGWYNAAGNEVANRDLIEKASDLDDRLKELGNVEYIWIPRTDNVEADKHCNEKLDEMEANNRGYSSDDDDSDDSDYY
ncbi:ribonuclease H-like domain-containing protein [Xylariaceae sp. FL0255]|nr:ribonuclease H-like domain-containing protein [Xylariaceae sp. FL0255]